MNGSVFDEIVARSGLSPLFARNALERAVKRAGLDPTRMTRSDVPTALPEIERTLQTFVPRETDDIIVRLRRIGG